MVSGVQDVCDQCFNIEENLCTSSLYQDSQQDQLDVLDIPAWAFKDGMTETVPHLTMVINEDKKDQKFLSILKKGLITPLYKKDDPLNPLNYRPIAITSSLSKIFEKLLQNQINQYLSSDKLLSPPQFSCMRKYQHKMLSFISPNRSVNMLTKTILYSVCTDHDILFFSVCIDLPKAFDSVPQQILMEKLNFIGFNDDALELNFSFLSHRSIQFVINNTVSDIIETYQGVPQGTVLGPLLFTITILQNTSRKNAELYNTPMTVWYTQRIQNLILHLRIYNSVLNT